MKKDVKYGEVYYANLGTGVGSEECGYRPIIVMSNNVNTKHSSVIIGVPLTTKRGNPTPRNYQCSVNLFNRPSIVLVEQMKALDISRLGKKITTLPREVMMKVELKIHKQFELCFSESLKIVS